MITKIGPVFDVSISLSEWNDLFQIVSGKRIVTRSENVKAWCEQRQYQVRPHKWRGWEIGKRNRYESV